MEFHAPTSNFLGVPEDVLGSMKEGASMLQLQPLEFLRTLCYTQIRPHLSPLQLQSSWSKLCVVFRWL